MRDVLMLLSISAFFGLCIAYVAWCDRIIGPDPAESGAPADADASTNHVVARVSDDLPETALDEMRAS